GRRLVRRGLPRVPPRDSRRPRRPRQRLAAPAPGRGLQLRHVVPAHGRALRRRRERRPRPREPGHPSVPRRGVGAVTAAWTRPSPSWVPLLRLAGVLAILAGLAGVRVVLGPFGGLTVVLGAVAGTCAAFEVALRVWARFRWGGCAFEAPFLVFSPVL